MKWRVTRNERCVYIDMGTGVLGMTKNIEFTRYARDEVFSPEHTGLILYSLFFVLCSLRLLFTAL